MIKAIPMEDWLRGCIYHDGRQGYVTLPTDKVHQIANYIQRTRRSGMDGLIDLEVVEEDRKTENSSEIPNNCEWSVEYAKEMLDTMPCEECGHWEHGAGDHYYCALLEMRQECFFESKGESTLMFANKPKTEPTISKMEQVDEPITQTETQNSNLTFKTLEYCDICDHKGCEECIANALDEHCIPSQFNKQIEDECAKEYEELGLKELKELIEADRKTENSSEKTNNCEHITEDGVTCAKYPACDGCLDNPLNKVKGSERLVKGSEQTEPTISKMEQVEDEPQTYVINPQEPTNDDKCFECDDFFTCGGQCNKIEDEPQTDEEYINNLPWTEVGNGEQTDCDHKCIQTEIGCEKTDCAWK